MNTRLRSFAAPAVAVTTVVLLLAGCGKSSGPTGAAEQPAATPSAAAGGDGQSDRSRQGFGGPGGGVSGEIAVVTGSTAQVRGTDGQTTVTWTSSTTFERTSAGTLADVKVGVCVTAIAARTDGSSSSDAAPVTSVAVSTPGADGTCTGGFGGRGGQRPAGASTDLPSGFPTGFPGDDGRRDGGNGSDGSTPRRSGAPGGFTGGFGGFTSGKVTAVSGSTITVDALSFGTTGAAPTTAPKQVTVDAATTYTTTTRASASAVKAGLCTVARGTADESGAVTATTMTLSDKVDGECGFGPRGFDGRQGGGAGDRQGATDA